MHTLALSPARRRSPLKFGPVLALIFTLRCCACDDGGTTIDDDGDGFPSMDSTAACVGFDFGYDCDDDDPKIHPRAEETAGDGIDSNCDGEDDPVGVTTDAATD